MQPDGILSIAESVAAGGGALVGIAAWAMHLSYQAVQVSRRQARCEDDLHKIGQEVSAIHDFVTETQVKLGRMDKELQDSRRELHDHLEEATGWKIRIAQLETGRDSG